LVDDAVFVDDLVSLQVRIKASGLAGESAKITLRRDNDTTPLSEVSIMLPPASETLTTTLVDRPTAAGEISYLIEIAPFDRETNTDNNRQTRRVSVRDEKIRVLLAQGYPSFEFRHLKTLLERDRAIQLSVYLQDADREFAEQDKSALRAFPVTREELLGFDVLIISDVEPRLLPPSTWQNIRTFVAEKGGGVAFLAGPRHLPWLFSDNSDVRSLLPIEIESMTTSVGQLPDDLARGFAVRPTPVGLQSAVLQLGDTPAETANIWRELAPLYWLADVRDAKPAAQVWAVAAALPTSNSSETDTKPAADTDSNVFQSSFRNPRYHLGATMPLILFQYVGPGRVLYHAFDSTWRWRLGAGDIYFARYWVQTSRFLARGKLQSQSGATLTADRREYRRGEVVLLRARFRDSRIAPAADEVTVVVDAADQRRRRVTLHRNPAIQGVFEGSIADLAQAQYEAVLVEPPLPGASPTARFSIAAPPSELARLEMDAAALRAAADTSRGKFYTVADADQLVADLPPGRRVPLENMPSVPLWNRWWLLAAFLACITTEWVLRKRRGML
jgi:hypothetical protein